MSVHASLRSSGGGLKIKRSVLKRHERIDELKKQARWKKGDKVFGLPKTKAAD